MGLKLLSVLALVLSFNAQAQNSAACESWVQSPEAQQLSAGKFQLLLQENGYSTEFGKNWPILCNLMTPHIPPTAGIPASWHSSLCIKGNLKDAVAYLNAFTQTWIGDHYSIIVKEFNNPTRTKEGIVFTLVSPHDIADHRTDKCGPEQDQPCEEFGPYNCGDERDQPCNPPRTVWGKPVSDTYLFPTCKN